MKKVFLTIGVVTLLASCGGNATKTEEATTDSTAVSVDSTKVDTTSVK